MFENPNLEPEKPQDLIKEIFEISLNGITLELEKEELLKDIRGTSNAISVDKGLNARGKAFFILNQVGNNILNKTRSSDRDALLELPVWKEIVGMVNQEVGNNE